MLDVQVGGIESDALVAPRREGGLTLGLVATPRCHEHSRDLLGLTHDVGSTGAIEPRLEKVCHLASTLLATMRHEDGSTELLLGFAQR